MSEKSRMKKIGLALLCLILSGLMFTGCSGKKTDQVVTMDGSAVRNLDAFKKAQEELVAFQKELEKTMEPKLKAAADKDAQSALLKSYKIELKQKAEELMNPLQTRAEAAVATIARKKNALIVLDHRIVLYGVEDITEEVKQLFEQEGEIVLPEEDEVKESPVGYFAPEVIRSLSVFKEAQVRVAKKQQELVTALQKRAKENKPNPAEASAMRQELEIKLGAYREQELAPLLANIKKAVDEVASSSEVSLVVDKEYVMYGGLNLTDKVAEKFIALSKPEDASEEKKAESNSEPNKQ